MSSNDEDNTNEFYTLVPREKLAGFKNGDHVKFEATIAEVSLCQQGLTINMSSIRFYV